MRTRSIAVAGCGPAGLAMALFLARAGHEVVLFDQMDSPGPVGSGLILQVTGLAVLRALGLEDRMRAHGARIDRLFGIETGSGRKVLDVRFAALGENIDALSVHRASLFAVLHDAVLAESIPIETRFQVVALEAGADGRVALISATGRRAGPFDLVIDALGARSALVPKGGDDLAFGALWASLPWPNGGLFDPHTLEQRYRRAHTMIGVMPTGTRPGANGAETAFFWSIEPRAHRHWIENGLDAWKNEVRALWPEATPLLDAIEAPEQMVLARYRHRTLRRPIGARVAHIGDSAHATSPQLGQGANMALLDARALSLALERHGEIDAALRAYAAARRWHVRLYQLLSFAFTPLYQSHSRLLPAIRDRVVAPLSRVPGVPPILAALVAGTLLDPRKKLALPPQP